MCYIIIIISATWAINMLNVEARGKGGAANGGGNSWRGGDYGLIFFIHFDSWIKFAWICLNMFPIQFHSNSPLTAAVFLSTPDDNNDDWYGEGLTLWTWIIIAIISTVVLGVLICLFYKTYVSCQRKHNEEQILDMTIATLSLLLYLITSFSNNAQSYSIWRKMKQLFVFELL